MKPMDFEEFLWAKGISKEVISYIKDCFYNKTQISNATHNAMLRYFRDKEEKKERFISGRTSR